MTDTSSFLRIEDLLRRAADSRREAGAVPEPALPPPPDPAPSAGSLRLSQIVIDPDQPRCYLPNDLRDALRQGAITADAALADTLRRAAAGDTTAAWFARDIAALAANVRAVGLQQPVRVWRDRARDGSTLYRLVDGERRYWAHVYLVAQGGPDTSRFSSLAATIAPDDWTLADVRRAQWAANLNRRDVPVIELALAMRDLFQANEQRFAVNKQPFLARLGDAADGLTEFEQLLALTALDAGDLLARPLKPQTVRAYLGIARNLCEDAVAEARANNAGFRALMAAAARQSPESQVAFLRSLGVRRGAEYEGLDDIADAPAAPREAKPKADVGRPTRAESLLRRISAAQDAFGRAGPHLARLEPESLQTLLSAADDLGRSLGAIRAAIQHALNATNR